MTIWGRYWFSLRHPIRTVRSFCQNIKWSFQRVRRGWCDMDAWDLDTSICEYLTGTLHYLADNTHGWPDSEFTTYEEWQASIHEAATHFSHACEALDTERNPYLDALERVHEKYGYNRANEDKTDYEKTITDEWFKWECDRAKWREKEKDIAVDWLKHYFYHLWD